MQIYEEYFEFGPVIWASQATNANGNQNYISSYF